jgi:glycosyltransferase involved in cell wall biosynthesis
MEETIFKMTILYTIPSLEVGGAELFLARLSNYFSHMENVAVFILDFEKDKRDSEVLKLFSKNVKIINNPIGSRFAKRLFEKIELIFHLKKNSLEIKFYSTFFRFIIKKYKIDCIHSHLYRSDRIINQLSLGVKTFTTLHGCYNDFSEDKIPGLISILNSFNNIVYITDKNLLPIKKSANPNQILNKTIKIYNGVNIESCNFNASAPDLKTRPLKIIIVSRCIEAKGWDIVIDAVIELNAINFMVELSLIGDGDYLNVLKNRYKGQRGILFLGKCLNVNDYIQKADVCCFPSFYKNESFPNSILEYMSNGKPIISTEIGEVPIMMANSTGDLCGFISSGITLKQDLVKFFIEKILVFYNNSQLLEKYGLISLDCIKNFDIKNSAESYIKLYSK